MAESLHTYAPLLIDFLNSLHSPEVEDPKLIRMRDFYAALPCLGFEPDEYLPEPLYPHQRDLSTFAYLQIAQSLPSENIIVLDLDELAELITRTVRDQYRYFAGFSARAIPIERLRAIAHMVVRDTAGLLRRTPEPQPAPPTYAAPQPFGISPEQQLALNQQVAQIPNLMQSWI